MIEYDSDDDVRKSFEAAYEAIRERIRKGGPGWVPKITYPLVGLMHGSGGEDGAVTVGPDQAVARS